MPWVKHKYKSINGIHNVLGIDYKGVKFIEEDELDKLKLSKGQGLAAFKAGEDVVRGQPRCIIDGKVYLATNLSTDKRPCMGIVALTAKTGERTTLQTMGEFTLDTPLTANKQVFLRANSTLSNIPIVAVTTTEDGHQILGRMLTTTLLSINIESLHIFK